jgi:hypothetical protein
VTPPTLSPTIGLIVTTVGLMVAEGSWNRDTTHAITNHRFDCHHCGADGGRGQLGQSAGVYELA